MTRYRPTLFATLCLATLAASLLSSPALASGYYRWIDEQGQTHFSQRPPEGRNAEYISRSTGRSISSPVQEAEESAPAAEPPPAEAQAAAAPIDTIQGLPERDPAQCQQARETLQVLDTHVRVRARDAQGEVRMLSPEEREAQRSQAQEVIELHC